MNAALERSAVDARAAHSVDLLRFERMLSALSARFISLPPADVSRAVDAALVDIVDTLGLDRSVLFRFRPESDALVSEHAWTRDGFPRAKLGDLTARFPWGIAKLRRGEVVAFESVDDLPPEAATDKASWIGNGIRSHASFPLAVGGEIVGALAFATFRHALRWPEELLHRLRLIAEIFGNALARKQRQEDLEKLLAFERIVTEIAASLVAFSPDAVDTRIEAALARVARFLEVDRATLWEFTANRRGMRATRFFTVDEAISPTAVDGHETPWIIDKLCGGGHVRFQHIDDMPAEAAVDRSTLRALGTVSMLAVALRTGDGVDGALSFATVRGRRPWQDAIVPSVHLLGEVFAGVLSRRRSERRAHAAQAEAAQHRERLAHLVRVHTAGEMSAGIAHEINQPLVAIENYALAARRHATSATGDSAKVLELLDKIVAQSSRAGDVIKHIRTMVRRHEFQMKRVDVRAVVIDSLRFWNLEGQLRDVSLDVDLAQDPLDVTADEIQMQQVIVNLVRNAVDAMEANPAAPRKRVTVSAGRRAGPAIFVRVADTGPGFDTADAERIFEPFYSTKGSGLGVGLSLCRTIVEAHGGRLWARPGDEGGAVFEFTLPCTDEPAQ